MDQSSALNALDSGERDFRAHAAATEGQLEHNMLILIISAVLHVASLIYHDIQIKISKWIKPWQSRKNPESGLESREDGVCPLLSMDVKLSG